ncbi:MAG: 7-cyano-7-deazaguanine synthase [Elusimicrobia bacterium]|nr:7-cyano-7-deazaguanine synthase [Elusimicrobiota bacterium]
MSGRTTNNAGITALVSGGLDSGVLLARLSRQAREIHPLFIANGHPWEEAEFKSLKRFLRAINSPKIKTTVRIDFPIRRLLDQHWGPRGYHPHYNAGYSANYIPGRNIALLTAAATNAFVHKLSTIALGLLKNNPYPDSQPAFFRNFETMINKGFGFKLRIITPLAGLNKTAVVQLGRNLPLHLTLSCARPINGRHCGNRCNKCAERQKAFVLAGVPDQTDYARKPPVVDWAAHKWPD